MQIVSPTIELGASWSSGGGASPVDAIGAIAADYAQLIAPGGNIFQGTGAKLFEMDAGILSMASTAQIGRVIGGVTITAAIVAENQRLLNAIASYCKTNGIGIVVEAQLDLAPAADWTYQWLTPSVAAGLPIVRVEDDDEPEVTQTSTQLTQTADYVSNTVAQIAKYYPDVQIGQWIGGSPTVAASFWATYNSLAVKLGLPQFSYVVADTGWNAPWVESPAAWQSWLQQVSSQVQGLGMKLTVLVDGTNTDTTAAEWTAQSEQHLAMLAQMPGVVVNTILVRSWQAGQPNAVLPLNQPTTIGNDALMISSTYSLYEQNMITASGVCQVSADGQVIVGLNQASSIGDLTIKLAATDLAANAKVAVVITADTAVFNTNGSGSGTVTGNGTGTIILDGTQADINAELAGLQITEPVSGPDTVDIEVFGANGRINDTQISVLSVAPNELNSSEPLSFTSATTSGSSAGWTQATATTTNGKIASESLTWNSSDQNVASGGYQLIKEDTVLLPSTVLGLVLINGAWQNPLANVVGANPLTTNYFNAAAFNPTHQNVQLVVLSTRMTFGAQSGDLEGTTDTLASFPPLQTSTPQSPGYLAQGGQQTTEYNTGSNPLWQPVWGNQFSCVVTTQGSQGQLIEQVFQGSARNGYQSVENVFDPNTGRLWETIRSDLAPTGYSSFVSGPMTVTQYNTLDNPNWDNTEWGSLTQVTVTWQDYYAISVSSRPPAPLVTDWAGGTQIDSGTWYSSAPQAGTTLSGLGSPGDTISAELGTVDLGGATVSLNGQWALALAFEPSLGNNALTITETDPSTASDSSTSLQLEVRSLSATAVDVVAQLNSLQSLAADGSLTSITLTDGGAPTLTLSAAQIAADATALAVIVTPYKTNVIEVSAAEALTLGSQPNVSSLAINDTAGNVLANLGALQLLADSGKSLAITLTDALEPSIDVTPAQQIADAQVLTDIGTPFQLNVIASGSAAPSDVISPATAASLVVTSSATGVPSVAVSPTTTVAPAALSSPDYFILTDVSDNTSGGYSGSVYSGPVVGVAYQYLNEGVDNIDITSIAPSSFIHSGSGNDAIDVSASTGINVLDGSTGSNFLVGGSGNTTFFADDRNASGPIWDTVAGLHPGDAVTLWGVSAQDFKLTWTDNQGAAGYTGLTLAVTSPTTPEASLTLAGYSASALQNGKLTLDFGKTGDLPGAPGSQYLDVMLHEVFVPWEPRSLRPPAPIQISANSEAFGRPRRRSALQVARDLESYFSGLKKRLIEEPAKLTDEEILECILSFALVDRDTRPVVRSLMAKFKTISGVTGAPASELLAIRGLSRRGVDVLKLVQAAAVKMLRKEIETAPVLSCFDQLMDYLSVSLKHARVEHFHILFLDGRSCLIADEVLARGTIDKVPVFPREIVKRCLELHATALVIVHNHPGGDPKPSEGDLKLTQDISRAAAVMGISLHDHIIVGRFGCRSFRAENLMR